ncbi:recombinase RecT [Lactobacillus sp. AN1001]
MNSALVEMQKSLTEKVGRRVSQMEQEGLALPKNYNYQNALKSAFFELDKVKDIELCTQASIANALLNMITQGLSPAKTQCYFIRYGNELQMQRSYFGTVAALKRLEDVEKISAEVIHEGDVFEIGANAEMETIVKTFEPKFENQDKPLVGAFAMIKKTDGTVSFTIMTKKEIDQSWRQSRNKTNAVQQNFSQEMAKRTVLNRAAKMFINTSDDSDLLSGAINQTTENEYDSERNERVDVTPRDKQAEDLFNQVPELPQESVKDTSNVINQEKKTTAKTAPKKANKPTPVKAVEKEKKETATEKTDDLNEIIKTVPDEPQGEEQTELLNHWGEPVNE